MAGTLDFLLCCQLARKGRSDGQGGEGTIEDPELLMVVMETREQIDEADSPEELQRLQQDNVAKQAACIQVMLCFSKDLQLLHAAQEPVKTGIFRALEALGETRSGGKVLLTLLGSAQALPLASSGLSWEQGAACICSASKMH